MSLSRSAVMTSCKSFLKCCPLWWELSPIGFTGSVRPTRACGRGLMIWRMSKPVEIKRELQTSSSEEHESLALIERYEHQTSKLLRQMEELETLRRGLKTPENLAETQASIELKEESIAPLLNIYPAEQSIHDIHIKMILIVLIIFVCIAGMMFIFIRDVVGPLEGIIATSRSVSEGNLAVSFPVRESGVRRDEIDDLAIILNDLLANFQEAFLLIGSVNKESRLALDGMTESLSQVTDERIAGGLSKVHSEALSMSDEIEDILAGFDFYTSALSKESESES